MLSFELMVTGLNSYIDTKTNGMPLQFPRKTAKRILIVLLAVAVATALFLAAETGWVVLICGGVCFLVGILYSYGPLPISHTPLGEIFSGVFEGFFIPFLVVSINSPDKSLIGYSLSRRVLQIEFNLPGMIRLFILSLPAVLGIADIMLANNICDLPEDIQVKRFTLPYYIGSRNSVRLFALNDYVAFAAVILTAALGILPPYTLAALLSFPFVQRNISAFKRLQSKNVTFPYSVQNFTLLMIPLISAAGVAAFIRNY